MTDLFQSEKRGYRYCDLVEEVDMIQTRLAYPGLKEYVRQKDLKTLQELKECFEVFVLLDNMFSDEEKEAMGLSSESRVIDVLNVFNN